MVSIPGMIAVSGIDHVYISVSELERSEVFYDRVMVGILGFRKSRFQLDGLEHIQYYNRHFGYVLRASLKSTQCNFDAPGLHHFCMRVESVNDVVEVARQLRAAGIAASEATHYPEYAPDYWASYFSDPDGIRLEITNYRMERRVRHDNW